MGCDIHLYVEKIAYDDEPGSPLRWRFIEPPEIVLFKNRDGSDYTSREWYWGRNYNLFALLADVRNGVGFAGVDTGDRVAPLAELRGLPADASPEYLRIAGPYTGESCAPCQTGEGTCASDEEHGWGEDGHSHSWFTLRELQAVEYDSRKITRRGWVDGVGSTPPTMPSSCPSERRRRGAAGSRAPASSTSATPRWTR